MTVQPTPSPLSDDDLPGTRSLVAPFNRAGTVSLLDLGFDAENGSHQTLDEDGHEGSNDIIGFPGERVSHVSYGFEGERWRLRNVAWVIAQSPLGNLLLDKTYRSNFRISFDRMAFPGERVGVLTNVQDKCISLDPRTPAPLLFNLLTMQLAICANAATGLPLDLTLNPAAALLTNRLVTADAEAAALQVAWEIRTCTTLPAKADTHAYWDVAAARQPELAAIFEANAQSPMAVESGMAAAAVIRAFYQSPHLREKAENEVMSLYRALPNSAFKDPKLMSQGFNEKDLSYKFALPGVPYALSHAPHLKLDDSRNKGIFAGTLDVLNLLQSARRNAGVKDRENWILPVVQITDFKQGA